VVAAVEIGGVRLHYRQQGVGPPVVLVHGLGGTSEAIWKKVAGDLAADFTVAQYDLRGTGGSDKPPGPYALHHFVDDLDGLIGRLALKTPALVGHSFGGSIALAFAAAHPDAVSAVVAIGGPTSLPQQACDGMRQRAETVEAHGMAAVAEAVATNGMAPSFREAHPAEWRAYVELLRANDPQAYAATCRVIADLDITAELPRIQAPVLLIAGDGDGVAPPAASRETAATIPDARFVEIADCGHILPWEKPEALLSTVRPFLREAVAVG
jgi:3-oxoadipate enol-lactonase